VNAADLERAAVEHLEAMTHDELIKAIVDLKAMGFSDHGCAQATRQSVDAVRRILAERREAGR
jgi:hypothetical protein